MRSIIATDPVSAIHPCVKFDPFNPYSGPKGLSDAGSCWADPFRIILRTFEAVLATPQSTERTLLSWGATLGATIENAFHVSFYYHLFADTIR
jgi:hypothetical protein